MEKHKGFTIVEILIVIVVIAILAAITVVAYNGITTNAENTKTINSVSEYVKVSQIYAAENGNYPYGEISCLGPDDTVCGNTSGTGTVCFGDDTVYHNSAPDQAVNSVATSIPAPSTQTMDCGGAMYGGAWFFYSQYIVYYLKGDQGCSAAGGSLTSRLQQDSVTRCVVQLPSL